jgi:preprotein translocase subunit YajC
MLFLQAAEGAGAVAQIAQPALGTLEKSVIGALLVISWLISGVLLWQLIKCQNARTSEQKEMRENSDKTTDKVITALTGFAGTLDKQADGDESMKQVMMGMKTTLDLLLMLTGGRRLSPQAGTPVVNPEKK